MVQQESPDDFLTRLDREEQEGERAKQDIMQKGRQQSRQLIEQWTPTVSDYLAALGSKRFGKGNYEIKIDTESDGLRATFSVEENIWREGMEYRQDSYDSHPYPVNIECKVGFQLVFSYDWQENALCFYDETSRRRDSIVLTEDTLKNYVAYVYRHGLARTSIRPLGAGGLRHHE